MVTGPFARDLKGSRECGMAVSMAAGAGRAQPAPGGGLCVKWVWCFGSFFVVFFFSELYLFSFLSQAQIFLFHLLFYLPCMAFSYFLTAQEFVSGLVCQ